VRIKFWDSDQTTHNRLMQYFKQPDIDGFVKSVGRDADVNLALTEDEDLK